MVFAALPRQYYHNITNPAYLSGQDYLDNFILKRKLLSRCRDLAKTRACPSIDGN